MTVRQEKGSKIKPGGSAKYAIEVWLAPMPSASSASPSGSASPSASPSPSGSGTASPAATPSASNVTVAFKAGSGGLAPQFTACAPGTANGTGSSCLLPALQLGAPPGAPLLGTLAIPSTATGGKHYTFTVTATTADPGVAGASDVETIALPAQRSPSPHPSGSHTPAGGPATTPPVGGVGATLPPGIGTPAPVLTPGASLGGLPGPVAGTDPGAVFPKVSPGPSLTPSPVSLPGPQEARVANASAEFPLDGRLIGIQVAGLAVLAAAVTIAVARLSLRRRPAARHSKDSA